MGVRPGGASASDRCAVAVGIAVRRKVAPMGEYAATLKAQHSLISDAV